MLTICKPDGSVKAVPEDFVVCEVVAGKKILPCFTTRVVGAMGGYTTFVLTKRGMSGENAYCEVARQLGVSRERVSDHGLKDAQAVTAQHIVVEGEFTPSFNHERIWLCQVGPAEGRLRHGGHDANHFSILVRTDTAYPPEHDTFVNFFGPQRFGDGRLEVGRHLLEGDVDRALQILQTSMNWRSLERIARNNRISLEQAVFHRSFSFELGFKLLQWQSHLWNMAAEGCREGTLAMWSPESRHLYRRFWNPSILDPYLVQRLHRFHRDVVVRAQGHHVLEYDEGYRHEFSLRSGSYATVFLASLYQLTDTSRERFG